jgi:coenzyme F420-0:L-glutamate ligase/coenzyme F420-1:gamma-L-glutamate ligase
MKGEVSEAASGGGVRSRRELTFRAIEGLPCIEPGDDVAALLIVALNKHATALEQHDVVVVTSKIISKAEDRFVDLSLVTPSLRAHELAQMTDGDPRAIEVVLWDTEKVSRVAKGALIVRHHGGHVSANAGLDQSNASVAGARSGSGPWVLRLPADPDATAAALRVRLEQHFQVSLAVIVSDSFGRPFRRGTLGTAIGVAGIAPLFDQRGKLDLYGRALEHTETATADQICAAADLVCGQADEARPAVLVRGLRFDVAESVSARSLCRALGEDLYL